MSADNRLPAEYIAKAWPRAVNSTLDRIAHRHAGSFPHPAPNNDNQRPAA